MQVRSAESTECDGNWWRRPAGGREVVRLALPLVLSTASWTLMHFVDRVFLTWYSREAIAAAMPAGMLQFSLICLPLGIAAYVNTFVAQYYGAGRLERVGQIAWQGIFLGLATILPTLLLIPAAPWIFAVSGHEPQVIREEIQYFQALAIGSSAAVIGAALSSFFTGLGLTRAVMRVDMAAALLNIALDRVLIWGLLGLPAWGVYGAGLATSISQWFRVAVFVWLISRHEFRVPYQLAAGCRWNGPLMGRLLRFGGPSGLQMFIEIFAFTAFMFLMGQLGETAMAATTIAFSINSIAFVPMLGLGIAVSTLVGQHIGAGRVDLAERATWTAVVLGGAYTGLAALLFVGAPDLFLVAYAAGGGAEFGEVRTICYGLLRYVAAYCVIDMLQIVYSSAIKGAGDTRFVLVSTLCISPTMLALGWYGLKFWDWGLWLSWGVVTAWICSMGVIFFIRFQLGPWRSMRVIEADVPNGLLVPCERS